MTKTLGIYYPGGSGGFFAFWHVLLCSDYRCTFKNHSDDYDLQSIMQKHWNITDTENWKSSEVWPDNELTMSNRFSNKIFLYNNPEGIVKHDLNIGIYTDYDIQYDLAKLKRANMFLKTDTVLEDFKIQHLEKYNIIRSEQQPNIESYDDLQTLPMHVKQDLEQFDWYIDTDLEFTYKMNSRQKFKNMYIDFAWDQLHHNLDMFIDLRDVVKTSGKVLSDAINTDLVEQNYDFTKQWLGLHPQWLQEKLCA